MDLHVDGLSTSRSEVTRSRIMALRAHSGESPNRNREQNLPLQQSSSLPCGPLPNYGAAGSAEDIEDTTLYFLAPSCADLTAYASGILTKLVPSSSKLFKSTLPPAISMVRLPSRQCHFLDVISTSTSRVLNYVPSDLWPTDEHQNSEDLIPSVPSALSAQHIYAHDTSPTRSILSYGVIGTLGKGTYGKVVLACLKDDFDGDLYAVKIVHKQGKHETEPELATLQFISDSSMTSMDDQENGMLFLQRLREAFGDEESLYIVLEYHPATLSDPEIASRFRVRKEPPSRLSASISLPLLPARLSLSTRPDDETVACLRLLIAEISLGLAFLHQRGIIHQDIKPPNIMLSFAGHAVIGDFGAATTMPLLDLNGSTAHLLDNATRTQIRRYGSIVLHADDFITFTPLYAAPELRERNSAGLVVYDERSDWWSLGVLLYELVTGVAPFHPSGGADVRERRSDGDHSLAFGELEVLSGSFTATNCEWYPHLEGFLRSLLSHDPNDRLSWPDIKDHHFLDSLHGLWTDIAALKHPPCPNPPTSYVEEDTSLTVEEDGADTESCKMEPNTCSAQGSHLSNEHSDESGAGGDISVDNPFHSSLYISLVQSWSPPVESLDDDDSDDGSIPQAMPSSASLCWAVEKSWESHYPGLNTSTPLRTLGPSSSYDDFHTDIQPLRSPFSSTPVLRPVPHHASDSPYPKSSSSRTVDYSHACPGVVVPEEITMSLLEAMDNRDRAVWRDQGRRLGSKKVHNQRFRPTTLARLWKKLFT